jgi:hypothetical protein
VDSQGLKMTEPRIASAIAFKTPETLKKLMSFLGLVKYFRDHIRNHFTHPTTCMTCFGGEQANCQDDHMDGKKIHNQEGPLQSPMHE